MVDMAEVTAVFLRSKNDEDTQIASLWSVGF